MNPSEMLEQVYAKRARKDLLILGWATTAGGAGMLLAIAIAICITTNPHPPHWLAIFSAIIGIASLAIGVGAFRNARLGRF